MACREIVFLLVVVLNVYLSEQAYFLKHDYIHSINKVARTWKAGVNFKENTPKENILRLLGSKGVGEAARRNGPYKTSDPAYQNIKIKKEFDARKEWPNCETMGTVRDQGNCGSCWAFGTTGAFADRLCVATNGEFNRLISAEELAFCCHRCGFGCNGGYPNKAWNYFKRHGVVTGGNYNTTEGCQPYKVPSCRHHEKGEGSCDETPAEKNHKCSKNCYGDETVDYRSDHWKTRDSYFLTFGTIQKDVQIYGPVEASFDVYDDFLNYKSGVYEKTENATRLGGHAVKLIGWGVEHGVEYWLMLNSWGNGWGDQGLFKIRKGTNECQVDDSATGGVPVVSSGNRIGLD